MKPIRILYFSDVLCVWAYVAQARIEELQAVFGERVAVDHRFIHVFGNTAGKFERQWADRGGVTGYASHVRDVVDGFEHVTLHEDTWTKVAPRSSMLPHLFLRALPGSELERTARRLRHAFFAEARNVSTMPVLVELARELELDVDAIRVSLENATAHAALFDDGLQAAKHAATVSPTTIFNEGRQRLTGNVGYRVIEANVRELIDRPAVRHSWC